MEAYEMVEGAAPSGHAAMRQRNVFDQAGDRAGAGAGAGAEDYSDSVDSDDASEGDASEEEKEEEYTKISRARTSGDVLLQLQQQLGRRHLEDGSAEMDYRRMEALRGLPESLRLRRQAKQRLGEYQQQWRRHQQQQQRLHHHHHQQQQRRRVPPTVGEHGLLRRAGFFLRRSLRHALGPAVDSGSSYFVLWSGDIKAIEGRHGTGVGTYFRFLRFLLGLNAAVAILTNCFLLLPQILHRFYVGQQYGGTLKFQDILTGAGWFDSTELYYGTYSAGAIPTLGTGVLYNMTNAYFYTIFICFAITLFVITTSLARSYRTNFIDTESVGVVVGGGGKADFSSKVFSGWDFAVARSGAVKLQLKTQLNLIKETLDVLRAASGKKRGAKVVRNKSQLAINLMVNLVVLGMLVGVAFLTVYIIEAISEQTTASFWSRLALPATVTALMLLVPVLFHQLGRPEDYGRGGHGHVRLHVYVDLLRTVLLAVVIVGAFMYRYAYFYILESSEEEASSSESAVCWENRMGQELYRLLVASFVLLVFGTFLLETAHGVLYRRLGLKWLGTPEFRIARNTMHLIYVQTLTWLGYYFCPLLPSVLVVMLVATFYLKKLSLALNSGHSMSPWRAAQSRTFFLFLTFFLLIVAGGSYVFFIVSVYPSSDCGPFQKVSESHPYEIMANSDFFSSLIIFRPAVVLGILVLICVALYYARSLALSRRDKVKVLRQRIKTEAKDKAFLIQMMQALARRQTKEQEGGGGVAVAAGRQARLLF